MKTFFPSGNIPSDKKGQERINLSILNLHIFYEWNNNFYIEDYFSPSIIHIWEGYNNEFVSYLKDIAVFSDVKFKHCTLATKYWLNPADI